MMMSAGGRGGGTVESVTTMPCPMGYAGGMRIGSLPRIGDQPSRARLAARSAARTPLHAMTYDLTVGVWFRDRKSTRLNSSHVAISYAVFCLKKKNVNRGVR